MANIDIHYSDEINNTHFLEVWHSEDRYLHLWGSGSSGKSHDAPQKVLLRILSETAPNFKHRCLVTRKVASKMRESVFAQFKERINFMGFQQLFQFNESNLQIKCVNGNEILFSGLDDADKLNSIQGITMEWHEEFIQDSSFDFMISDKQLRGTSPFYYQMICTYNPLDINSWMKPTFHDKDYGDTKLIHYKPEDNKFLDEQSLKALSNFYNIDPEYYKIYYEGQWGALSGLIYTDYVLDEYFPSGYSVYGLDFGFEHYCVLCECAVVGKDCYTKIHIYENKLNQSELVNKLRKLNINPTKEMFISPERADLIDLLYNSGFNAKQAKSGAGSVFDGIMFVKQFKKHINPNDIDFVQEHLTYKWKTDKNGRPVTPEQPVKFNDDGVDAERYGLYSGFFNKVGYENNIAYNSIVKKNNRFSLINGF